ncbi:MAG: PDGLE domain-containing protein [Methanomicrobiales archaeon]
MMDRRTFVVAGVVVALIIAVAAPFLASGNPDGLESAFFSMHGAKTVTGSKLDEGQVEHAEEAVVEKTGNDPGFEAPLPDYSVPGLDKAGEVLAIVAGTLLVLILVWGISAAVSGRRQHG